MLEIKEIDTNSISRCVHLYQSAYKNAPWNEEYSLDEITECAIMRDYFES